MTDNRGYPPTGRPPYRPTSSAPAATSSTDDMLSAAARLRAARGAREAADLDPRVVAVIASQLLERGHYRAAVTAAELAEQMAAIATAARDELFGTAGNADTVMVPVVRHFCATCNGPVRQSAQSGQWGHLEMPTRHHVPVVRPISG